MFITQDVDFEDSDTGDELILNPDLTYEVVSTFVNVNEHGLAQFTYRVKLARYQFRVRDGYEGSQNLEPGEAIEVIDLEETPDTPEGV